jgi:hypothetical protein
VIPQADEVREILADCCRCWVPPSMLVRGPPANESADGEIVEVRHLGRSAQEFRKATDRVVEENDRTILQVVQNGVPFDQQIV